MSFLPVERPEIGRKVKAVIRRDIGDTGKWDVVTGFLIAVDEAGSGWRFVDDNSELNQVFDVVYWEYWEHGSDRTLAR